MQTLAELQQALAQLDQDTVHARFGIYSFYEDDEHTCVRMLCTEEDPRHYEAFHYQGTLHTGTVSIGPDHIITKLDSTRVNAGIVVDGMVEVSGEVSIYGWLEIQDDYRIHVLPSGKVHLYQNSTFHLPQFHQIKVEDGGEFVIHGTITIDVSQVIDFKKVKNLTFDTCAVWDVRNLHIEGRSFSFTDYIKELSEKSIAADTIGSHDTQDGAEMGYVGVTPHDIHHDQIVRLYARSGTTVLGDFALSILGYPKHDIGNKTIISSLVVNRGASLHITDAFTPTPDSPSQMFLYPEMYIGAHYENSLTPGFLDVCGELIVSGRDAKIVLDNGGGMMIAKETNVYLRNHARIQVNNTTAPVLLIEGTLTIDTIDQLVGFQPENIRFGEKGLLVILNTTPGTLFSISKKETMEEYRLFGSRLEHVKYHIPSDCGINVDEYHEYYYRDMTDWWSKLSLEEAIQEGLIIWHPGAYINLDINTIPWAETADLNRIAHLFRAEVTEEEHWLQAVVNRFVRSGVSDVRFRISDGSKVLQEMTLKLSEPKVVSIYGTGTPDLYRIEVEGGGDLFMRNRIATPTPETIIHHQSEHQILQEGTNDIDLR